MENEGIKTVGELIERLEHMAPETELVVFYVLKSKSNIVDSIYTVTEIHSDDENVVAALIINEV